MRSILYVYPQWHTVSFSLVAKKHIQHLREWTRVQEWDELAFPDFYPVTRWSLVIHPYFYAFSRWITQMLSMSTGATAERIRDEIRERWKKYDKVVAVEVADSDRISKIAVWMLEPTTDVVVPSTFSRDAFIASGCRKPVHIVPHGVDEEWYDTGYTARFPAPNPTLEVIRHLKEVHKVKLLLFWLWHSPERKGWPEVQAFMRALSRERDDVTLVLVTTSPVSAEQLAMNEFKCVNVWGFLKDPEKMYLYDLADLTLLFSRGGAFELCGLESIARGTPAIGHRRGAWRDYMPTWLQVKEGRRVKVFEGNSIHVGYGYTVDVEDALNLAHSILDDVDDYKAKTKEYAITELKDKYNWRHAARLLLEIAAK